MTGAFTDYPTTPSTFDETVTDQGRVRAGYEQIAQQFQDFGLDDVRNRGEYVSKSYHDQGVTFDYEGEERPFPLDAVPRVIDADAWQAVERGVEGVVQQVTVDAVVDRDLEAVVRHGGPVSRRR